MKKKIYIWCSNLDSFSGEGILANKFINDLKIKNSNHRYIIKSPNKKKFNLLKYILKTNYDRFYIPFRGVIYLWLIYFTKNNKSLCFVNYLPLWNFLIFLSLPPNTMLGPVTGGSQYFKKPIINYLIRHYIFKFLYKISFSIIRLRFNKVLFSTDLLKDKINNNKKFYFNYILKDVKFKKYNLNKKYDIIFYLKDHPNKNTNLQINLANQLAKKYKIITVGKKIRNNLVKNLGYIPRKKVKNLLIQTKFAFLSTENIMSLFSLDCFESNTYIIYDKRILQKNYLINCSFKINYSNYKKLIQKVDKLIKNYKHPKKFKIKKINNFDDYFKI